jgi:hypothetical protein
MSADTLQSFLETSARWLRALSSVLERARTAFAVGSTLSQLQQGLGSLLISAQATAISVSAWRAVASEQRRGTLVWETVRLTLKAPHIFIIVTL